MRAISSSILAFVAASGIREGVACATGGRSGSRWAAGGVGAGASDVVAADGGAGGWLTATFFFAQALPNTRNAAAANIFTNRNCCIRIKSPKTIDTAQRH